MKNLLEATRVAIARQNWYAALFISMTLPDICCALEFGSTSGDKYANWFDANLPDYKPFVSGKDCYALRCSLLHQGMAEISHQNQKELLDHILFMTSNAHLNVFKDAIIDGVKEAFLQVSVAAFCEDLCVAAEKWLDVHAGDQAVQARLDDVLEIRPSGYVYKGAIKFE